MIIRNITEKLKNKAGKDWGPTGFYAFNRVKWNGEFYLYTY